MVLKEVRLVQKICSLTLSKNCPLNSCSLRICLTSLSPAENMRFALSNGDIKHGERASIYYPSRIEIANCHERAILLSQTEIDSLQCRGDDS